MESSPEQDKMDEVTEEDEALSSRKTTRSYGIAIDSSRIRAVPVEEQSTALRDLAIDVFDHEEFEQGVLKQVDEAIAAKELEAVVRAWEKELKSIDEEIRTTLVEIAHTDRLVKGIGSIAGNSYEARRRIESVKRQRENKLKQLKKLEATQKSLYNKLGLKSKEELDERKEDTSSQDFVENDPVTSSILQDRKQIMKQLNEEREKLIQSGQMTPFGGFVSVAGTSKDNEEESLQNNDYLDKDGNHTEEDHFEISVNQPSPEGIDSDEYIPDEDELHDSWKETDSRKVTSSSLRKGKSLSNAQKQKKPLNVAYNEEDDVMVKSKHKKRNQDHFRHKRVDDGDDHSYVKRIRHNRIQKLLKEQASQNADSDSEEEMPDMEFDNKMKIPGKIWHKLYQYQQTGVKWLWELHGQQAGGIIGDEMGLGKTIQAIAFLAGLKYSNIGTKKSRHGQGPILIVCPVTVIHQWVAEFHKWAPEFRVAVLHDTGSHHGSKDSLIKKICQANGVLVTSYSGVRINTDSLLANHWDYIILDEGHKIRNPDAEITLACKQFRTPHRIILTGSPMQNNLRELWSLFDFVFPGKLGTLPVFMTEVSVPITSGGYSNASDVQVQTAYKCACVLRDTINPYLLRRLKKDVKMCLDLPDKNEQVLFCRLTEEQRELYQEYLNSREVQLILDGNYKVFPGLIMLRKLCNHPDLTSKAGSLVKAKQDKLKADQGLAESSDEDDGYGDWRRAGKMIVVEALLKMWKAQGHRVLLFSQSRQMLHILEQFVISRGYNYRRMDGSTSVASRQPLVNKFNKDSSIFVFLLTTRVGGIGVNLIGANRVIIYDPDWNPSTDIQARERSWRIGQTKNVTIYRLLTSGTIEEKIYHRQIFKQFLTNRVLKDPKQRRFFKTNDLYELFTLDESYKKEGTETSAIFAGTNCEIKMSRKKRRKTDPRENAQPVNTDKHKHNKKTKTEKTFSSTLQDDGGAFSIDARDISEFSTTKKFTKEAKEKNPDDKNNDNDDDDKAQQDSMGNAQGHGAGLQGHGAGPQGHGAGAQGHGAGPQGHGAGPQGHGAGELGLLVQQDTETAQRLDEPALFSTNTASADTQPRSSSLSVPEVDTPRISIKEKNTDQVVTKTATSSSTTAAVGKRASTGDKKTSPRGKLKHTKKVKASLLSDKQLRKQLRLEKRKKRRRKKGKIEGHVIDNLDYHEVYSEGSSAADLEATGRRVKGSHNEDTVLKTLFKAGGVHSALQHDVIMESGNPDYTLVETEANRVAQQAVQALKKSRQRCLRASAGVPTWTGLSGQSGLQNTSRIKPRFGKRSSTTVSQDSPKLPKQSKDEPALFSGAASGMQASIDSESDQVSSNKLLEKMRARNNIVPDEEAGSSAEAPSTEHDELLAEMSQFVASGGAVPGQASTREIIERFSTKLPKENSSLFRAMLRRICEFTRGGYQAGIWKLKNDFS